MSLRSLDLVLDAVPYVLRLRYRIRPQNSHDRGRRVVQCNQIFPLLELYVSVARVHERVLVCM